MVRVGWTHPRLGRGSPERQAWIEAGRIAQAAHSLADLAGLDASHPDPQVSYQAMPRLCARFPNERRTLDVLVAAAEPQPARLRLRIHGFGRCDWARFG